MVVIIDRDDDDRHEHLFRFENYLFIVRFRDIHPEMFERREWIFLAADCDAAAVYRNIDKEGLPDRKHEQGQDGDHDEYGEKPVADNNRGDDACDGDDADRPVPVGGLVRLLVLERFPRKFVHNC